MGRFKRNIAIAGYQNAKRKKNDEYHPTLEANEVVFI
jgi:hypothetical protein